MIYKDKELKTIGEIFDKALLLAKNNSEECEDYLKEYIKWIQDSDENLSLEEATSRAKSNLGYFAGYYSNDVRKLIAEKYDALHPIFGNHYDVTPEEAFNCGKTGTKLNRK